MLKKIMRSVITIASIAIFCAFMEISCYAGVTVSISDMTHSWPGPGTPQIATCSDPNHLPDANTGASKVPEKFASGRGISQSFTVPAGSSFILSQIVITGVGNATPSLVFTMHLFDITGDPNYPASYTPGTSGPDPNHDFFENCYFLSPVSGERLITFTLTGNDRAVLEAGHMYAFEIWGPAGATDTEPFFWIRGGGSFGNTYPDGDGYECPYDRTDVNIPTGPGPSDTRNFRSKLTGNSRDMVMAIYGTALGGKAYTPSPYDNQTDVSITPLLSWTAGQYAASANAHRVYIGTNYDDVNNATTSSTDIYLGTVTDPCYQIISSLTGVDYYWRVDEVNAANIDSPWKGDVWHFTTTNTVPVIPPARLHVEGNKIKDPNGNTVVLRGLSMIDLGATNRDFGVESLIDRITNTSDPNGNSPGWYPTILRVPVCPNDSALYHYSPLTFDSNDVNNPVNELFYELLRSTVDYCARKGLYIIIDWHLMEDTYNEVNDTNVFWAYIAPRFANDTHVLFELFNEPMNTSEVNDAANWNSVRTDMQTWIDTIRASAPHNLILVGSPSYDQVLGPIVDNPVADDNVVYVCHLYPYHWRGFSGTDPNWFIDNITTCAAQYPVICTEWGFTSDPNHYGNNPAHFFDGSISNYGQPLKEFFEDYGIGNTAWVLSNSNGWESPIFYSNWTLRCGDGEMGCFTKDWLYQESITQSTTLTFRKCAVKAGKTQGRDNNDINNIRDAFTASGTFPHFTPDFNYVDSVEVNIVSLKNPDTNQIYSQTIPFSMSQVVKGKYTYKHKITKADPNGTITSLKFDFNKNTFAIQTKNINLTGLGAPLRLTIEMGTYTLTGTASETIINGSKKLIPTRLMRMFQNTLIVTRTKATHSTKALSDSLSVKGEIAVADINNIDLDEPNLVNVDVNIVWGDHTFTVPAGSLVAAKRGHSYKCSKIPMDTNDCNAGFVTAAIDLDKCTFTISVKNADGLDTGTGDSIVPFGINYQDEYFNETADVNVVTGRSY
jgi:hypothetical protein